ncbi:MAG: hypothetical protein ACRYFU_16545 [Janthinobacterium lividum]
MQFRKAEESIRHCMPGRECPDTLLKLVGLDRVLRLRLLELLSRQLTPHSHFYQLAFEAFMLLE